MSTVGLTPTTPAIRAPAPKGPAQRRPARLPYLPAIAICLGIGGLTLLVLPTDISYDPWSWLIWGRELDHLSLVTRGSASAFKPLAAFIDAFVAPAGRSAPKLWMALVRGATVLSILLAFEIGRRLQGRLTGVLAALTLLTIRTLSSRLALQGMAEPLEMCCGLAAVECGLSDRRGSAIAWMVAGALLELELTGALILVGVVLLVLPAERRVRAAGVLALLVVLVGCAWFVPGLVAGHGALGSEAASAANPVQGGPLLARVPALATLNEVRLTLLWPLLVGWIGELVLGVAWLVLRRPLRPLFVPALIAALFVLGVALGAQLHVTTGTSRFLIAGCAVGVVVAVCLWAEVTSIVARLLARRAGASVVSTATRRRVIRATRIATGALVLLGLLALVRTGLVDWRDSVRNAIQLSRPLARAEAQLPVAVAAAGGAAALLACGRVYTGPFEIPDVAWNLHVPSPRIWHSPVGGSSGAVVSLRSAPVDLSGRRSFHPLATARAGTAWQIYSSCARGQRAR